MATFWTSISIRYGWIFTFCPLAGIEQKPAEVWQELQVHLNRGDVAVDRRVILEHEAALAWQNLWVRYGAEGVKIDNTQRQYSSDRSGT